MNRRQKMEHGPTRKGMECVSYDVFPRVVAVGSHVY
jgi:hypothetical protein